MRILRIMLGRYRMLWGWCPACNSDAPSVDRCLVCAPEQGRWSDRTAELVWQRFKARGYR